MAQGTRSKTDSTMQDFPIQQKYTFHQKQSKELLSQSLPDNTDPAELNNLSKEQLIDMVVQLNYENSTLKVEKAFIERTNKRLEDLERQQNLSLQYNRRDSVVISGIPANISDDALEDEAIKVFESAKVLVNGVKLDKSQIQGCHRIGKKGTVILKTLNRKFAIESLYCGKNLKNNSPYSNSVYINNSFCKEFGNLNYLVRMAKKANIINRWKVKHGVTFVRMEENGAFLEISHINDLAKYGISTE